MIKIQLYTTVRHIICHIFATNLVRNRYINVSHGNNGMRGINPPCMYFCYVTIHVLQLFYYQLTWRYRSYQVLQLKQSPCKYLPFLNDFYRPVLKQNGIFQLKLRACTDVVNSNFNHVFLSTAHFNHGCFNERYLCNGTTDFDPVSCIGQSLKCSTRLNNKIQIEFWSHKPRFRVTGHIYIYAACVKGICNYNTI